MKSYAFYVVAAAQGAMAQLPAGEALAPDRLPALEDGHVAKVQVPSKFADACYQNSGGQVLKRDGAGKAIEVLKYPCISAQEILGYCQKEEFNNNVDAQKKCLFGEDSTLESDYEGCVKCEEYNGLGSVEYIEATRKRIGEVKEKFLNGNQKFSDVDGQVPFPPKEGTPIKSKAQIAANGTADINILSYWKDYRLPQQAGTPLPDNNGGDSNKNNKGVDNKDNKGADSNKDNKSADSNNDNKVVDNNNDNKDISAPETKDVSFSIAYFGWMSLQVEAEQSGSAKFRNVSGGADKDMFIWMEQSYKLVVCISNAASAQGQVDMDTRLKTVSESTKVEAVREQPLYDTAQIVSNSSKEHESLKEVAYANNECRCFEQTEVKGAKISNDAAKGDGTKFTTSVTNIINIDTLPGGEGQGPPADAPGQTTPSNDGQGISGKTPSTGNDGTTPVRPDNKDGSGAPGSSSGSSPVTLPAPVTPTTQTAPKGSAGVGRNATSTSCTGASCPFSNVIVSGASVVSTSSLIVAAAVLVAAL